MACRYTYNGKTYDVSEFDDLLRAMPPAEAARFMPGVDSLPYAPFVGKTDSWVRLALKRIIKLAVDEGYDKVAFINGEQSADRYDLSKQVDAVRLDGDWDQSIEVSVARPGEGFEHIASTTKEKLADVIGKELASKAIESGQREFKGLDLKIGGEGMKSFYDQIVPNVLRDVLKKLGGVNIETVRIGKTWEQYLADRHIEQRDGNLFSRGAELMTPAVRRQYGEEYPDGALAQPGFTITPKLVELASGGLPLFSKSDSAVTRLDALLHSLITDGKPVSELLSVIERTATKPFQRELARRLASLGLDAKVVMSTAQGRKFTVGRNASDFSAGYDPRTNEVLIFRPGNLVTNILHELMHAATYRAIRGKGDAALRMKALWMALKKHSSLSDENLYPMSNVDEFVAAAFSDSGFRNTLQQINSPFTERSLLRTAWDTFVDIVRNILGLPAQRQSALSEALNIGDELMQEQHLARSQSRPRTGAGQDTLGSVYIRSDDGSLLSAKDDARRGMRPIDVWRKHGWLVFDGQWRRAIASDEARLVSEIGKTSKPLAEVFSFPRLQELYPDVYDAITVRMDKSPYGDSAWFDPVSNEIVISDALNKDMIRAKLIHEIQHAIQSADLRDSGASPVDDRVSSYMSYFTNVGEIEARDAENTADMTASDMRYVHTPSLLDENYIQAIALSRANNTSDLPGTAVVPALINRSGALAIVKGAKVLPEISEAHDDDIVAGVSRNAEGILTYLKSLGIPAVDVRAVQSKKIMPDARPKDAFEHEGSVTYNDWHSRRLFGTPLKNDPKPVSVETVAISVDLEKGGNAAMAESVLRDAGFQANAVGPTRVTIDLGFRPGRPTWDLKGARILPLEEFIDTRKKLTRSSSLDAQVQDSYAKRSEKIMQEQGDESRHGNVLGNVEGSARLTPEQRADKILSARHRHFAPLELVTRTPVKLLGLDKVTSWSMTKLLQTLGSLVPEKVKGGFVSDYGNPQDVVDQRNAMRGEMAHLIREGGGLVDKLSGLTRAESRVAYEWMNSQDPQSADWFRNQLPPESIKTLGEIEQMIDKLSKRALDLGQLDPEAYKRNRFAYLHRSYVKHTAELTNQDRKARSRAIEVLGEQYRSRGMTTPVEMSKIENTAPDWWKRKLKAGKADVALINQKFIRLERRETVGVGVAPLDGIGPAQQSRIREVRYWPAEEPIPTRFATWDQAGTWEVRGTKGKDVLLWRDFTKQEREQMGEIDEVRFAVAKTLHGMIHDVETGNYLRYIAEKHARKNEADLPPGANIAEMGRGMSIESMRRSFAPDEWVKVPETKAHGTGVAKYGDLAGRFVPGPIWNDIRQTVGNRYQPFGELYSEILKAWKVSKTGLSPSVHMNNVMSNFVMADWHDVGVSDLIRALNVIVRAGKDPAYKVIMNRFEDAGGTGGMFTITELQREQMGPLLDALRAEYQTSGEAVGMVGVAAAMHLLSKGQWKAAIAAGSSGKIAGAGRAAARAMIDLYQMEDVVFRLAKWMNMKSEGQSDILAAEAARRSFLDYEINAPWIQAMRQTGFPFISFTYRAVPMLIDIIKNKPWKLMKIGLTYGALNAFGYALSGGDEDKERKALPEEKSGSVWGMGVPKLIRMPWNDAHGSPVFLDIRRWVPVGDVLDLGQTHAAVPLFPALVPSGPVGLFMELATNTSQFTGQNIVKDTDSPKEVAQKVSDYIYKSFTPNIPLLLGSYSYESIMDAGKGKTDAFGRERSVAQAVSSSFGVKLSSYPEDVMRRQLAGRRIGQQREIEDNVRALTREFVRKGISRQEYEDKLQYQREKSRKIDDEYMGKLK